MVGGIIVGLTDLGNKMHVTVAECPHWPKHCIEERPDQRRICPHPDTCSVYTDGRKIKDGERVSMSIGDSFWWQGGLCMWTPQENTKHEGGKCGVDYDIELKKVGYSH